VSDYTIEDAIKALAGHDESPKCGKSSPGGLWTCARYKGHEVVDKRCSSVADGLEPDLLRVALTRVREFEADRDEWRAGCERAAADENANAADLERVSRERDAYRRAKAENDERLMCERDEARHERDESRAALQAARVEGARAMLDRARYAIADAANLTEALYRIRALDPVTVAGSNQ